jgi:hypothetical protein
MIGQVRFLSVGLDPSGMPLTSFYLSSINSGWKIPKTSKAFVANADRDYIYQRAARVLKWIKWVNPSMR